ncbi:MAG: cell surface glycoprotein 2 [Parcubacteria group bacterium Gr01-1014_30]|nr:MAG: cell surface glycoprotein 2 [Parcubacteria group bacterium Gr01-1014_30]
MKTKKSAVKKVVFLASLLAVGLAVVSLVGVGQVFSQTCPQSTTVSGTTGTLVGEITDDGGDSNIQVRFQYGKTTAFGLETPSQTKMGLGLFCADITGLEPNTTYFYRAVATNSGGTSFGETRSFTTKTLDLILRANGSRGPITVNFQELVTLSWTSQNAVSCNASGDWSGSKSFSGSQLVQMNQVQTNTFTLTCTSSSGQQVTDSVQVLVNPKKPTVVTKPAIVTN